MWKSRKFIGEHDLPEKEEDPIATNLIVCPECLLGDIIIQDNMGTCSNCGNHMEIEYYYTEDDLTVTTNALGQKMLVYSVLC